MLVTGVSLSCSDQGERRTPARVSSDTPELGAHSVGTPRSPGGAVHCPSLRFGRSHTSTCTENDHLYQARRGRTVTTTLRMASPTVSVATTTRYGRRGGIAGLHCMSSCSIMSLFRALSSERRNKPSSDHDDKLAA